MKDSINSESFSDSYKIAMMKPLLQKTPKLIPLWRRDVVVITTAHFFQQSLGLGSGYFCLIFEFFLQYLFEEKKVLHNEQILLSNICPKGFI